MLRFLAVVLLVAVWLPVLAHDQYRVIPLDTWGISPVSGINNSNVMIGQVPPSSTTRPAKVFMDGTTELVAVPDSTRSWGYCVSDNGYVVGHAETASENKMYFTNGTQVHEIPGAPGEWLAFARGVNTRGQVAGYTQEINGTRSTAYMWTQANGKVYIAGTPQNNKLSRAWDINENGLVVGEVTYYTGPGGTSGGF